MMKLRSKRLHRSLSKFHCGGRSSRTNDDKMECGATMVQEIKWELRPGGMLVQKRDNEGLNVENEGFIMVRVATGSQWHEISIQATSTFGEMKMVLSMVTGMEPKEQRVLFKGKERDDVEHLHMVGVRDKDKVVLLEDPANKERKKLHESLPTTNDNGPSNNHAISM
ncbi:BAG family molecular chaperone regulator 2-like [Rutidosis leptorrhynchoides]|uniref:BAG family molecular chaperone regulator 2-like n=1 Tax=Rutidosis leptorrhynchoides TaxID=125765 RepID=UPI003A98D472